MIIISPGEYYFTPEDLIIQTVLGSCISVCLYSDNYSYTAMNHFMLPGNLDNEHLMNTYLGRYGLYAMDKLISEFVKNKIRKERLKAKVFGGADLFKNTSSKENIPSANIKFVINYLTKENIPIISSHLGGILPRKILFLTESKKVLLKEIASTSITAILQKEKKYEEEIFSKTKNTDIVFLDDA